MPVKGGTLVNGPRHNPLNKALWKKFIKDSGKEIPYLDFCKIIHNSNELISERIADNISGFKLPELLGYCVVTRYKPKPGTKHSMNFQKTKEVGAPVYHTNFHSFGYKSHILWLTDQLAHCKYANIYKFVAARKLSRKVAHNTLNGKIYNENGYGTFKQKKIRLNNKYFK